jgi:hypothetical protein
MKNLEKVNDGLERAWEALVDVTEWVEKARDATREQLLARENGSIGLEHQLYDPTEGTASTESYGPGGLSACRVCNGAEGSLPTDCPGRALTAEEERLIYAGALDYRRGPMTTEPDALGRLGRWWMLAPEQLGLTNFDDVGAFHQKFEVRHVPLGVQVTEPRSLTRDELAFRVRFLVEELNEFLEAVGYDQVPTPTRAAIGDEQDLPHAFDALLDLSYVTLGTAHLFRFPWQAGWNAVQRANMAKERCHIDHPFVGHGPDCGPVNNCISDDCHHGANGTDPGCQQPKVKHGARGSRLDVIKPAGWTAPDIAAVLVRAGRRPD